MTPQDEAIAQRALKYKRLSPLQVEQIQEEIGRTGRSFKEIALGRGLLSAQDLQAVPEKQLPMPLLIALFLALTIGVLGLILVRARYAKGSAQAEQRAVAAAKAANDAIHKAEEARGRQALEFARAEMARADAAPPGELNARLDQAIAAYSTCINYLPNESDVRIERAKAFERRGSIDRAVADLEVAIKLTPERSSALQQEIARLKGKAK